MKRLIRAFSVSCAAFVAIFSAFSLSACSQKEEKLVLRISNWEEYIDLGEWDEGDLIDIENPYDKEAGGVMGVNSMVDDFTEWFNSTHDYTVTVEYSTFGTNEDLYNRLNLGDVYDLVCPSDYMIMKLLAEDKLEKYSQEFLKSADTNYYYDNVSPYIYNVFEEHSWTEYAACYMWGTTGIVYNPELVEDDDVTTWRILKNSAYKGKVTVKDNVRDAYFAALGILDREELLSEEITADTRNSLLNATDDTTIAAAEDILKEIKENVYSFETDSGKADMITGKVAANFQWSGDGVFIMDEADDDEDNPTELWYSVPEECTNLWFDGWVMLKDGIGENAKKKEAAEAFVNFVSRPDNAVRNMCYIGYTSSISGNAEDIETGKNVIYNYLEWNYGAGDDATETYEYDVSYFFGENSGASITADKANFVLEESGNVNRGRQLFAQYPPQNVTDRSVVMLDFGDRLSTINQMWINVRCLDLKDFNPAVVWTVEGVCIAGAAALLLYKFRYKIFIRK